MARRLLELAGVDYDQWRVLTRTMLLIDTRSAGPIGIQSGSQGTSQRQALALLGLFYGITGLFLAALVMVPDVFVAGVFLSTVMMFMIGTMVLIEYQSVIVSPDDYAILGFRPVSSRTYFAVKLTNVLIYVGVLSTLMGAPSIIAHTIRRGPLVGVTATLAVYATGAFIALAMIVAYGLVLRFVHPQRLRRVLSYLQMVMSIFIYGGYALFPRLVDEEAILALELDKSAWMLAYPPAWFASILELGVGTPGVVEIVPALAGIASVVGLLWYSTERLSLSYARHLSALASTSESSSEADEQDAADAAAPAKARAARRWLLGRDERRAVALLVRAQFRFDMKFRMSVLGLLPLTGLYVFLSLDDGPLPDPFVTTTFGGIADLGLLHLAVVFLPLMLVENLSASDSYQAAWVFFATPADRARLVVAAKNVVAVYFVLPYLLFVAGIFAWFFESLLHAAAHTLVLGLFANLVLGSHLLARPQLPFAKKPQKAQRSGPLFVLIVAGILLVMVALPLLLSVAYASAARTAATIVALFLAGAGLHRLAVRRAAGATARIEFAG